MCIQYRFGDCRTSDTCDAMLSIQPHSAMTLTLGWLVVAVPPKVGSRFVTVGSGEQCVGGGMHGTRKPGTSILQILKLQLSAGN